LVLWDNIYELCCYNRCHGNVVKEFWVSGIIFMNCVL
jgi:hypothetical protein